MAKMNTKDLDVVYFCREGINEELRYSLRSVEKNLDCRNVWIFGGKPVNIKPDYFVPVKQLGKTKWDKVRDMFVRACLTEDISEDFILMNDDFFIMKKTSSLEPCYRCSLYEHIVTVEEKFSRKPTNYTLELRKAVRRLKEAGLGTNSYELHIPMIMNRQKLLETMGAFPDVHATRSLYGNYAKIGGRRMDDVKIYDKNVNIDEIDVNEFLSTQDSIWTSSPVVSYIKDEFNERSRFERD